MNFFIIGTILGLSAGMAPGPLLALLVSETIQNDIKAGIKVACSPIVTDFPIIILTIMIFSKISDLQNLLGLLSISGGFLVMFMGYKNLSIKGIKTDLRELKGASLIKGILVNALSPYPYLFWLSVGTPLILKAMNEDILSVVIFISSFYIFLVGSKIVIAVLIGKWKSFLAGKAYIYVVRSLGIILFFFSVFLFRDGFKLLGIV